LLLLFIQVLHTGLDDFVRLLFIRERECRLGITASSDTVKGYNEGGMQCAGLSDTDAVMQGKKSKHGVKERESVKKS
jgi:hypothetical protein